MGLLLQVTHLPLASILLKENMDKKARECSLQSGALTAPISWMVKSKFLAVDSLDQDFSLYPAQRLGLCCWMRTYNFGIGRGRGVEGLESASFLLSTLSLIFCTVEWNGWKRSVYDLKEI